ncbi:MAG TPA: DNA primase [Phycisphaerales bacterium]|nr:DNA primase [Phycisphaerales bacterium]
MFDPSDKVRVQEATDIVKLINEAVPVKKKGKDFICLCPFHNDRNPSMFVVPGKQLYKCFSCGAGGDCFSWMMDYHKMSFPEALEFLAEKAGIKLAPRKGSSWGGGHADPETSATRDEMARANAFACEFFRVILKHGEHGATARAVLEKRGVSPDTVERFAIGAAPDKWDGLVLSIEKKGLEMRPFAAAGLVKRRESGGGYFDTFRHRLMFPIHNTLGQVVAFGGRRLREEDNPKYLNSAESALFNKSATLYALPQALKPREGERGVREEKCAVVVEGYMDAVACHQAGVSNVVATLGTALNAQGARVLARQCDRVVLLFDGDEAGQRAGDRALEVLFGSTLDVRIATMTRAKEFGGGDAKDPDELVKQPGGDGVLRRVIDAGTEALTYRCERLRSATSGLGVQAKAKVIEDEIQRLVELGLAGLSPVHKQMVVQRIAALAGVNEGVIREAIAKARRPVRHGANEEEGGAESPPIERYKPVGARETALACVLAEPVLWEELSEAQRSLLAPALFEREIAKKLAAILDAEAFSAQTFTLSRVRAVVADESVVRAAQDFASEVSMVDDSPDVSKRQLHACMAKLSAAARDESRRAGLAAGLASLRPSGAARRPEVQG